VGRAAGRKKNQNAPLGGRGGGEKEGGKRGGWGALGGVEGEGAEGEITCSRRRRTPRLEMEMTPTEEMHGPLGTAR
jgi:hypothetical protein